MAKESGSQEAGKAPAAGGKAEGKAGSGPEPAPPSVAKQLAANLALLERAVRGKEARTLTGRLLRQTTATRRAASAGDLAAFIGDTLPRGHPTADLLLASLSRAAGDMETEGPEAAAPPGAAPRQGEFVGLLPEVEAYCILLTTLHLVDQRLVPEAREVASAGVDLVGRHNRRTLDGLAARLYFYLAWAHEASGTLASIRSLLLRLHRTAVLRHDEYGAETLLNLLLRNYLHYSLYDQAEKFRSKAGRPEASRSPQQLCRYLFYLGKIRAVQLEYSEAKECLEQAQRKAPMAAVGFRAAVAKWLAIVRLLLGEVPDHAAFTEHGLAGPLQPYFRLAQATRLGDLTAFQAIADELEPILEADKLRNLVVRLRHNVIRSGLRRINAAYSRISLQDVAARLGLASKEDAECIVAKAIRDGGVDARLDHGAGTMVCREAPDAYATAEPAAAFHERVAFCLDIHNEAVRAMRFDATAKPLETAETVRQRLATEEEIAKEVEEHDDMMDS